MVSYGDTFASALQLAVGNSCSTDYTGVAVSDQIELRHLALLV